MMPGNNNPGKSKFSMDIKPYWCPGCGDFGILLALKNALDGIGALPHEVALISGIGNSGHFPHWLNVYGAHTLHGRLLPFTLGVKLSNHELTVIGIGGDGDGYGIGMGHFIHAMRRNIDITYIVANNAVYGLTTGQVSPTSGKGMVTKSTPYGSIEAPVNPISLALSSGATYLARGFAGEVKHLSMLIENGIRHKGFSFIEVLQPCPTFNKVNTHKWYNERVYKIGDENDYDPSSWEQASSKAREWGEKIPIGLFFKSTAPTYEDQLPQLKKGPVVKQDATNRDIEKLMDEFI